MFNKDGKRPPSKIRQSANIQNSTKRDEVEQKLPDIQQGITRNTGLLSYKTGQNRISNQKNDINLNDQQDNIGRTAVKPPQSSIQQKRQSVVTNQEQLKQRVGQGRQIEQEDMRDQQIQKQTQKKDFISMNKNNAITKKASVSSSRMSGVSQNKANSQSNIEQEQGQEDRQMAKIVKPMQFTFHTENRIEHRREMNKLKQKENIIIDRVNYHIQRIILCFSASSYRDVYKLMKVCKKFYSVITTHYRIWQCVLTTLTKPQQKFPTFEEMQDDQKIKVIRQYVEIEEKKNVIRSYDAFFADYRKLFEYCSTKENLPNKLIQRLKLSASATINKLKIPEKKFLLRSENFSSHLLMKFDEIQKINLQFLDEIRFEISFFSVHLKTSVKINRKFSVREMHERCVTQKAFCYYEERNFLTCFFEGDSIFLYTLFEISAMELVTRFRFELEKRLIYEQKQQLGVKATKLQSKYLQRDMSDYQYDNFAQYFRFQSDFELMINVHNSQKKNLYTFIDTRCFPATQTNTVASFLFEPGERFFIENVFCLDNKAGMKETVQDLLLMDLVLKDRDRFLICFSGYVRIQNIDNLAHKNTINMNFDYSAADEYQSKRIFFQQPNLFSFELLIIQTKHEAVLKNINVTIHSDLIQGNLP